MDPGPSSQSLRSDQSMGPPIAFKEEPPSREDPQCHGSEVDTIFQRLKDDVLAFVEEQLDRLHRVLTSESSSENSSEHEEERSSREAVLNITLDFLRRMKQDQLAERLRNKTRSLCLPQLKGHLKQRFSQVFEGVAKAGSPAPLKQIYTELYIIEGGASMVTQEHDVRHIETVSRRPAERSITCEDLFKSRPSEEPVRTVLTKGIAGIGKTVLTQKFGLDWSEGKASQDIQLLFPFTFRELNVLKDKEFSLVGLLGHFFSQTKGLCRVEDLQVLFIFDGLDECRLPLDFIQTRVLTEPTESASLEELLVNLIRGSLLPSARLWITTRPAAANQIPAECVSMVTEVRGFTDPQKEDYFRKRFRDQQQATAIISHIKKSHILFIMCYVPVFCWILSVVLQIILEQKEQSELPKSLTEMYIHFLVVQAKLKNIKYHEGTGADLHWTPETREMVLSLGKLAFQQLLNGNLIFYESDLSECGLDAETASKYSGVFTEVFIEESGLYQNKVYSFIHLSVQEFLAALYVHHTFFSSGENLLKDTNDGLSLMDKMLKEKRDITHFHRSAVKRALQSPNGHLDLFLRFLLGLSLPTNHKLLQGLLAQRGNMQNNEGTVKYIYKKLNEGLSADRSMNLFYCLNELNDSGLLEGLQRYTRGGLLSKFSSPGEWGALVFLLLSSDSDLEEFNLRKYRASETALLNLLPVVKASTKAILSLCNLSPHICGPLGSMLSSSSLIHLDLSNNDLQDSGVELLCEGLISAPCRLKILRLSGCLVSERGGASLARALSSANSHLTELDLSYNDPGSSVELLTVLREASDCPLESLRLDPYGSRFMTPGLRKYSCEFCLDPNTAQISLLLSKENRTVTRVKEDQSYPDHEDRFINYCQVLSSTSMSGRCYWEASWSGGGYIAMTYKGICRRGDECELGSNDHSWALKNSNGQCYAWHNNESKQLGWITSANRVGVFLDSEAGVLSFYEVYSGREPRHLHTFNTTFTEPLFPGFALYLGSNITL